MQLNCRMCLGASKLRKSKWSENKKNQKQYWRKILKYDTTYKKTVIRVRKKHCGVSSHMCYVNFTFKGSEYTSNIVLFMILLHIFLNVNKTEWLFFLSNWDNFRIRVTSSCQLNLSVVSIYWVMWGNWRRRTKYLIFGI